MISELPDDILFLVLLLLPLNEAGRTSVLSKRWRHLWAYTQNLNLDEIVQLVESRVVWDRNFNWVDQIVSSHKASIIDEFRLRRISTYGSKIKMRNINKWLRFAKEKRVKRLEIDLSHPTFCHFILKGCTFPSLSTCNRLTSLELGGIDIQGEVLESFLCSCRALELLSVKYSDSLVCLNISGPSLSLKHLTLYYCRKIEQLEISAPNLESFCYYGPKLNVNFKSTPQLAQVTLGSSYGDRLENICYDLSSRLSHIKELTLNVDSDLEDRNLSIPESIRFTRLEKLNVNGYVHVEDDLYCLVPLIKACPSLKHFKLRRRPYSLKSDFNYPKREQREWEACRLNNLKIVEIVGFVGHTLDLLYKPDVVGYLGHAVDIELAAYLDKSAVSLDKIIADTRNPRGLCDYECLRTEARKWAEELRAKLKPGTELEII